MVRLKWAQLTVGECEETAFDGPQAPPGGGEARRRAARASRPLPPPELPPPPPVKGRRRVLHHLAAGAIAGATAKTVEAPLDRVKIIFQVSASRFSFRAAARQMATIARNEGVAGLWKGNGAAAGAAATAARRPRGCTGALGRPCSKSGPEAANAGARRAQAL
jgi:hypothetical protein